MKIKLKGDIDIELRVIGLKDGDQVEATKCPVSKVGCLHFTHYHRGHKYECSIWPENYEIIPEPFKPTTNE